MDLEVVWRSGNMGCTSYLKLYVWSGLADCTDRNTKLYMWKQYEKDYIWKGTTNYPENFHNNWCVLFLLPQYKGETTFLFDTKYQLMWDGSTNCFKREEVLSIPVHHLGQSPGVHFPNVLASLLRLPISFAKGNEAFRRTLLKFESINISLCWNTRLHIINETARF